MKFKMHVDDLFEIGGKTIFAGELTADGPVANTKCFLRVDGVNLMEIVIKGEVRASTPYRDLWTDQAIDISRKDLQGHDVWLVADSPLVPTAEDRA